MEIKSNIDELIKKYQDIASKSEAIDWADALLIGVNAGMGSMKFRVFNSTKDKAGNTFGKYIGPKSRISNRRFKNPTTGSLSFDATGQKLSKKQLNNLKKIAKATGGELFTEYEKKRLAAGRQIAKKDLEFYGTLRKAIVVVKNGTKRADCLINSDEIAVIARGLEAQLSRIMKTTVEVWGLDPTDREVVVENTNTALKNEYDRLFSNT